MCFSLQAADGMTYLEGFGHHMDLYASDPYRLPESQEAGRRHTQIPSYFSHENGMRLFIGLCLVELFIQQE